MIPGEAWLGESAQQDDWRDLIRDVDDTDDDDCADALAVIEATDRYWKERRDGRR